MFSHDETVRHVATYEALVRIEQERYHSLEATDEMGVVFEAKAHRYIPNITEQKL